MSLQRHTHTRAYTHTDTLKHCVLDVIFNWLKITSMSSFDVLFKPKLMLKFISESFKFFML